MSEDTSSISRSNCKELQFDGYFSIELQQIWFREREEKIIYEEFIPKIDKISSKNPKFHPAQENEIFSRRWRKG